MAFVQAIVRAYEARQMSALGALEKAQIPPELINDAEERITALQMEALSDAAMRELDDEALGWFERRLPWGNYGMLARASISAPSGPGAGSLVPPSRPDCAGPATAALRAGRHCHAHLA